MAPVLCQYRLFVCLNVFIERETSGERSGVRELKFSNSYITATWGCSISVWKVKMDNELERRMRWEGGEERSGWQWLPLGAGGQIAVLWA